MQDQLLPAAAIKICHFATFLFMSQPAHVLEWADEGRIFCQMELSWVQA
jgi:hypothetical protein